MPPILALPTARVQGACTSPYLQHRGCAYPPSPMVQAAYPRIPRILSLNHHPGACPSSSLYLTITNDVRALTYSPSSCMRIIFNPPVPQCMHFIFIAYPAVLTTQALILPTSPRCTPLILSPPTPICLPFILQGACPLSLSSPGLRRS